MDTAAIIFVFLILISFFVVMFTLLIKSEKYEKAKREQEKINLANNEDREFETVDIKVKVVDQYCTTRMIGVKYPKSIEEYFIVFQIDNDETLKLSVPKECYDGFEIGQVGVLTLVDGELYSFKLD